MTTIQQIHRYKPMSWKFTEKTQWRQWVTPRIAQLKPIHRWYLFPHSFSSDLVHSLIKEWKLSDQDIILDPFLGSGTTLLAAKEMNVPGNGYDLSPLAILASKTKVSSFAKRSLQAAWETLEVTLLKNNIDSLQRVYPELLYKALPEGRLEALDAIATCIDKIHCPTSEKDFFRLALISIIPHFSHAVANGGWLRWLYQGANAESVKTVFKERVEMMLSDVVNNTECVDKGNWDIQMADARVLPSPDEIFSAVITSPPYPNRHDYTRVFSIELMFQFLDWSENRALRYQSFHSHPESRPKRPAAKKYKIPNSLESQIHGLADQRIKRMLRGYFLDMYLCLCEIERVCCTNAKIAFVVGNARYDGNIILVDELTAEIGEQAGLLCKEIRAVRWRGNSAQQMGKYGRVASRESIVIFEKP